MAREEEDKVSSASEGSDNDSSSDASASSGSEGSSSGEDSSPTRRRDAARKKKAAKEAAAQRKRKEAPASAPSRNERPKKKSKAYKFLDLEAGEEDSDEEEEFEEEGAARKGRAAHQQEDWASRPNRGQKRFGDLIQRWEERAKNEEQQAEHAAAEHEQRREVAQQRREIEARRQAAAAAAAAAKVVHPSRRGEGSRRHEERRADRRGREHKSSGTASSPSPSDVERRERKKAERHRKSGSVTASPSPPPPSEPMYSSADEGGYDSLGELPEAGPLPEPSDSKLFLVKCFDIGHEREIITRLSSKYEHFRKKGVKTGILSAFASDNLKGYIYVEGKSVNHIKRFVTGIRQINANSVKVVPASEMLGVFRSAQEAAKGRFVPLKMGEWVRIKRHPTYSNDLAQVVECFDMDVEVKIRPRINYDEDSRETHSALFGRRTGKKPRPHASFFDPIEAENRGGSKRGQELCGSYMGIFGIPRRMRTRKNPGQGTVERVRYRTATNPNEVFDQYRNERYKDGYLYRRFKRNALITGDDVQPSITEISEFLGSAAAGGEGQALLAAAAASMSEASGSRAAAALSVGDAVVVTGGDMKNLRGKVVTIDTDRKRVSIEVGHGKGHVTVAIKDLSKHFDMGDHVKILDGASAGDTGTVIKVSGSVATVLTDNEPREVKCQSSNLKLTAEVSKGIEKIGQYKVGDLVTLNVSGSSGVGVIVSIAASGTTAKIIGNDNRARNVPVGSLGRHRDTNVVFLMDVNNNPFKPGALLKILPPHPLAGKGAQVKHIMNNVAWVKVNDRLEDGGIVAITGHQVELVANRTFGGKGKGGKGKGRGGVRADDFAPEVGGGGGDTQQHNQSSGSSWGSQWGSGGGNKSWGWNSGGGSSWGGGGGHHDKGSGGKGSYHSGGGKGGGKGDSRLVGKRIRIIKGIYKGQVANVIDVTDTKVYVQLEAKVNKRLFIPKDQVRVESEIAAAESSRKYGGGTGSLHAPPPGMMGNLNAPPPGMA